MTQSDICLATREVGGRTDICRRSRGHQFSSDAARREHYDPSNDEFWMEHDSVPRRKLVRGSGRTGTFQAHCLCGRSGAQTTRSDALKDAQRHLTEVASFADVNGLILREGDAIRAKLTTFDGPAHLFGMDLIVVKLGRSKVHVTTEHHGGHTWAVTAATTTRVKPAPRSAA